ncbi:MAG: GTPase Era [candidate division WOR-3 bacterium]
MKVGFVSIVGKPNVGKSTLINRLIGTPISIVSNKPQTTRNRILGIWTNQEGQIIFIDTPGHFKPKNKLEEAMQSQIDKSINDADLVMVLIDNREESRNIDFSTIEDNKPIFLLINKIDLIKEEDLKKIEESLETKRFTKIFPISALRGDNVEKIIPSLLEYLKEGEPFYPEDYISDRNERFFIEEFIRETIFEEYGQEIPYSVAVKVENMKDNKIDIKIFVERESQKGIIIGKGGEKLKKVLSESRKKIERFLGYQVYMNTWVEVKKNWRKNEKEVRKFGYYE